MAKKAARRKATVKPAKPAKAAMSVKVAKSKKPERLNAGVRMEGVRIAEPLPHDPALVRETRALLNASQPVFAGLFGVQLGTYRNWEQGDNEPPGPARRLMTAIRERPKYWARQLRKLTLKGKAPNPRFRRQPVNEDTIVTIHEVDEVEKPKGKAK